jgi:hypothetical protein
MSAFGPSGARIVILLAPCLAAPAGEDAAVEKPPTPAEEYRALLEAHAGASSAGVAMTDEERLQFVGRVYRFRSGQALKFLALAEKHPDDPIAVDALIQAVWYVNTTPWPVELVGKEDARARAFVLLQRDHIRSDKLGPLCQRLATGFAQEYETFLRAVREKSPHESVRAQACLALARFLMGRLHRLRLIEENPELAREFEGLFGKEYLAGLRREDRAAAEKEAESLFEEAAAKYAAVKLPGGGTAGEKARAELHEVRHIVPGKEAPDIEGEDQDGKRFRLSDYRGKVVLIDFWHEQ